MEYRGCIFRDNVNKSIFQKFLCGECNRSLMIVKVVYPVVNKNNDTTNGIIECMNDIISDIFSVCIEFKVIRITNEGPVLAIVLDRNGKDVKQTAVRLEDKYVLGKCVDIDVYDNLGNVVTRRKLGIEERRCFLCDNCWEECEKRNLHKNEEIIRYVNKKYKEYIDR